MPIKKKSPDSSTERDSAETNSCKNSPGWRAWLRFRRNKPAMVSLVVMSFIVLTCVLTLPISKSHYYVQDLDLNWAPPLVNTTALNTDNIDNTATASGTRQGELKASRSFVDRLFGYDMLGRSLFWRCLFGGAVSLGIGLAAALISVVIGTAWGAVAGWFGGRVDNVMMRLVDVLYGLPYVLMIILLIVAFEDTLVGVLTKLLGPGQESTANMMILFLAIGLISWLTMARVIRGQVLSLKTLPYIEAAKAMGVPTRWILVRHLLPNLIGPIIVYATLTVPQAILQESFLSFLGIGIKDPMPTWGSLASEGVKAVNTVQSFWWIIFFPCLLLALTLLCLNFIGDGLRDALDPKTQKTK